MSKEIEAALLALDRAGRMMEGVTGESWLYSEGCVWGESVPDETGLSAPCYGIPVADVRGDYDRRWGRRLREGEREANAKFIAWSREGVPALIASHRATLDREAAKDAENERLRAGIERLGSMEAMTVSHHVHDCQSGRELTARVEFARALLGADGGKDVSR